MSQTPLGTRHVPLEAQKWPRSISRQSLQNENQPSPDQSSPSLSSSNIQVDPRQSQGQYMHTFMATYHNNTILTPKHPSMSIASHELFSKKRQLTRKKNAKEKTFHLGVRFDARSSRPPTISPLETLTFCYQHVGKINTTRGKKFKFQTSLYRPPARWPYKHTPRTFPLIAIGLSRISYWIRAVQNLENSVYVCRRHNIYIYIRYIIYIY